MVAFSTPYLQDRISLVVRRDSAITTHGDLAGKRIGMPGSLRAEVLGTVAPDAIPVPFVSSRAAVPALLAGHLDAIAAPASILGHLLADLSRPEQLRLVPQPLAELDYALALPQGDERWHQEVNAYLSELTTDGRLQAMARRWLGDRQALSAALPARAQAVAEP